MMLIRATDRCEDEPGKLLVHLRDGGVNAVPALHLTERIAVAGILAPVLVDQSAPRCRVGFVPAKLQIESFFPADRVTAQALRG